MVPKFDACGKPRDGALGWSARWRLHPREARDSVPRDARDSAPRDARDSVPRDARDSAPRDARNGICWNIDLCKSPRRNPSENGPVRRPRDKSL